LVCLLDTDVLIYHIKGIDAANQLVYRLIEVSLSISSITYLEVSDGIQTDSNALSDEPQFRSFCHTCARAGI
jgi:predicted nucleic acid-binding protein